MVTSRRFGISTLVGLSVALASVHASASPSARLVYLRNAGTESCPDESAVRAAVSARLGYDPFFLTAAETMFIELSKEKSGYHARIKLVDEKNDVRGTREIAEKGRSCSAMIDTLALSISIAIDPDSLTRPPPAPTEEKEAPAPTPPPPEPPPREPAPSAPVESPPPPPPASSTRVELLVLPAAWVGTGPSFAFGGEIGARLKWPHVSVGLEARGDLPASRSVSGVDVEMMFLGGSLVGCGHSSLFFACARGTLGSISATSNASRPLDASELRFLLGASAGTEIPLSDTWHFVARLTGNFAVDRQTIVLNDANAFELPSFSGGLEAGALVHFR